jgi:hypothetical protein
LKAVFFLAVFCVLAYAGCTLSPAQLQTTTRSVDFGTNVVHQVETRILPIVPAPYQPLAEAGLAVVGALLGGLAAKLHSATKSASLAQTAKNGQSGSGASS